MRHDETQNTYETFEIPDCAPTACNSSFYWMSDQVGTALSSRRKSNNGWKTALSCPSLCMSGFDPTGKFGTGIFRPGHLAPSSTPRAKPTAASARIHRIRRCATPAVAPAMKAPPWPRQAAWMPRCGEGEEGGGGWRCWVESFGSGGEVETFYGGILGGAERRTSLLSGGPASRAVQAERVMHFGELRGGQCVNGPCEFVRGSTDYLLEENAQTLDV